MITWDVARGDTGELLQAAYISLMSLADHLFIVL